jgi:hypothetical protein
MEQSQTQEREAQKEEIEKLLKDAKMHIPLISYRSKYDYYKLIATVKQLEVDLQSKNFKDIRHLINTTDVAVNEDNKMSSERQQKLFNEYKKVVLDEINHLLFALKNTYAAE